MTTAAPQPEQRKPTEATLLVALARSEKAWKLGGPTGHGQTPRERTGTARQRERGRKESAPANRRWALPDTAPVVRGAEAGRAGFWRQRCWQGSGSTHPGVAAAALAVTRRRRRAKRAGGAGRKGLRMLMREPHGERHVWRGVQGPSVEAEAQRQRHRALATLQQARARTPARLQGLRRSQGRRLRRLRKVPEHLAARRLWDGAPLPPGWRRRGRRVSAPHQVLREPMAALAAERRALCPPAPEASREQGRQGRQRQGSGLTGAWWVVMACLAWRALQTRRAGGGWAGVTPPPEPSGARARAQGSAKAGNRPGRGRTTAWAWRWGRSPPERALSGGWQERVGGGGKRGRRRGMGAVARQFLLALWRFRETGACPAGAVRTEASAALRC